MNRRLIDRFNDDFNRNLSQQLTRVQTFEKAKKEFEDQCGFTPYSNYNSYKGARRQDRRKRGLR